MNNNIDDTNPDQFKIPTNVNPSPRSSNLTSRVLADEYSSTITYNSYFFESNRPKDDPPRSNSSLPKITNSSLENPPRDHDRSDLVPISCRETGGGGRDRFLNHEQSTSLEHCHRCDTHCLVARLHCPIGIAWSGRGGRGSFGRKKKGKILCP